MKRSKSSTSSASRFPFLSSKDGAVSIRIRVRPRSSKKGVAGTYGDLLAVSIASAPVDGEANRALIELMAKLFGVSKSSVRIDSGQRSREKRLRVQGLELTEAERIIAEELE